MGKITYGKGRPDNVAYIIKMPRILISYGWNRIAYIIAKSLGSRGINVFIGDSNKFSMAGFSRFAKGRFFYPSFYQHPKEFIERLIEIIKEIQADVYIPTHEESLIVAKYIELFPSEVIIPLAPFNTLMLAHNKRRLLEIARNIGVHTPQTFKINSLDELSLLSNKITYPVVIKLCQSNSAKGVFYATNQGEFVDTYLDAVQQFKIDRDNYPLVQEYVTGEGWGVSMLYNHGELRAKFTHRRLREKTPTGGTSTRRISVVNPMLEEAAQRLLTHLKWHGVAMVEFKYNPETKKYWLMEVNPRFWGSLALAVAAGVDFPWLLYRMATEGDIEPVLQYQTGVTARWLLGDMLAFINHFKHYKSKIQLIKDFLFCKDNIYDDFHWDDPLPFVVEALYYFSKFLKTGSKNPIDEAMLVLNEDGVVV